MVYAAGSVWITDEREGVVRRLDPLTGAVRSTTNIGGAAFNLSVDSTGMWASIPGHGEIALLDISSGDVIKRIDVGGDPTVAIEAGGALEVASNSDGWFRRIELAIPAPRQLLPRPMTLTTCLGGCRGLTWARLNAITWSHSIRLASVR